MSDSTPLTTIRRMSAVIILANGGLEPLWFSPMLGTHKAAHTNLLPLWRPTTLGSTLSSFTTTFLSDQSTEVDAKYNTKK